MAWHALSCRLGPGVKVVTILFAIALCSYLLFATHELKERPGIRGFAWMTVMALFCMG